MRMLHVIAPPGTMFRSIPVRTLPPAIRKAFPKSTETVSTHEVAAFVVVPIGRKAKRPKRLKFPLIVKSVTEDASAGISQNSVVDSDEKLEERVAFIHDRIGTAAIVEQYIDGREIYVGVLGNDRLTALPIWELKFTALAAGALPIARIAARTPTPA